MKLSDRHNYSKLRSALKETTGIDEPIESLLRCDGIYTVVYKSGKEAAVSIGSFRKIVNAIE